MARQQDLTSYRYEDAVLPPTWTICGVKLRPFSMGHLIILEKLQSPLVSKDKINLGMQDGIYFFIQGILICALDFEDNVKMLENEQLWKEEMDKFTSNLLKNMDADPNWNIYDKLRLFAEYIAYYMDIPIFVEEHSKETTVPSGTDWKQNMFLIFKKLGYGESEILNMSFKKLFFEWASYAESEGAIKVLNKMEVDQLGNLQVATITATQKD